MAFTLNNVKKEVVKMSFKEEVKLQMTSEEKSKKKEIYDELINHFQITDIENKKELVPLVNKIFEIARR